VSIMPSRQPAAGRESAPLDRAPTRAQAPWAGNPPHPDAARQRLLDAATRCIARDGLAATSVASVAAEAGVSRPTVYRYFDDRDELVRDALRVSAEGLRDTVLERIRPLPSAADMIVEAIVIAVFTIPDDPVLRAIWNSAAVDATVVGTFTERQAIEWTRVCLRPAIEAGGWPSDHADEAIEMILRLVLSLLITPAPRRSPHDLRAFLRRRFLPALVV
jgi:AcrR family transcriptional regulator